MTPGELGDSLAQLVWESFSDFLSKQDVETPLPDSFATAEAPEGPTEHTVEEALIFFMWAHTRGVQLAFLGRAPDIRIREGLDALHRAVFEDMVEHGTPSSQLPIFEQRVGAVRADVVERAHHVVLAAHHDDCLVRHLADVIVAGMGKPGFIAQKISATFAFRRAERSPRSCA